MEVEPYCIPKIDPTTPPTSRTQKGKKKPWPKPFAGVNFWPAKPNIYFFNILLVNINLVNLTIYTNTNDKINYNLNISKLELDTI